MNMRSLEYYSIYSFFSVILHHSRDLIDLKDMEEDVYIPYSSFIPRKRRRSIVSNCSFEYIIIGFGKMNFLSFEVCFSNMLIK